MSALLDVAAAPLLERRAPLGRLRPARTRRCTRRATSSFSVDAGEVVGIVGESGSGKSVTALAVLGLIDAPGRVRAERLALRRPRPAGDGASASGASLLGGEIAMIFQDPMTSLNPSFTVAFQLMETIGLHEGGSRAARARARAAAAEGRRDPRRRSAASTPSRTSSRAA